VAVKEAGMGSSGVRVVAVIVAMIALGGCGGSTPKRSSVTPVAQTAGRTQTRTETKTVSASSSGTLPALVAKTRSSVVRIQAYGCGSGELGTGFLIGPRLVATVDHVVAGASSITLKQGGRPVGTGIVVGEDPTRDVALIQTSEPLNGTVLSLATGPPQLGEPVAALGFPLGLPLTATQGSVSGIGRTVPIDGVRRRDMVQTDAAVNPGNSGGPLIDVATGDVVGLVDLGTDQANGIGFAVSAQVAEPLLQAWQTSPQAVSTTGCSDSPTSNPTETSAPPTQTSTTPAAPTYNGKAFSIAYPSDWQVQDAEQLESYGTDTTIVSPSDPNTLIRVDVSPHTAATSPQNAAQPVIDALQGQPGYQQLDMSSTTLDGFPALHWEFLVRQGGVLLHKEDVFFIDTDNDDGVGILTSAPASQYGQLASSFAILRDSLAMH
jgi:S1-C subfamily serine protease